MMLAQAGPAPRGFDPADATLKSSDRTGSSRCAGHAGRPRWPAS